MKGKAKEIREKVIGKVQNATRQFQGMEDEIQKLAKNIQEKLLTTPADGLKKLDELLKTVAVTDFVEKLKAIEVVKQGGELRKDLLDRFGLAMGVELDEMRATVDALTARVQKLEKKKPAVSRSQFQKLEKAVAELKK